MNKVKVGSVLKYTGTSTFTYKVDYITPRGDFHVIGSNCRSTIILKSELSDLELI